MKTTVREFKQFCAADEFWPKDSYYDYESFTINQSNVEENNILMRDDKGVVEITNGIIIDPHSGKTLPLDSVFRKWKKKNAYTQSL